VNRFASDCAGTINYVVAVDVREGGAKADWVPLQRQGHPPPCANRRGTAFHAL